MKRLFLSIIIIAVVGLLLRCGGSNGSSVSNKVGKFAVKKISSPGAKEMINKGAMKSVTPINGGTINASITQYFILQNIGTAPITNVIVTVLTGSTGTADTDTFVTTDPATANVTGIQSGYTQLNTAANITANTVPINVIPGKISSLDIEENESIIQLMAIEVSHGTPEGANIGYTNTLPPSLTDTYIIITGISNGEVVQINLDFTTVVNLAAWYINTTASPILKPDGVTFYPANSITNTGTVPILVGGLELSSQATSAYKLSSVLPFFNLAVGDCYISGSLKTIQNVSVTPGGFYTTININSIDSIPTAFYNGLSINIITPTSNAVCDYLSLDNNVVVSNSGNIISYDF